MLRCARAGQERRTWHGEFYRPRWHANTAPGGLLPSRGQRVAVSAERKQTTYAFVSLRVRRHSGALAKLSGNGRLSGLATIRVNWVQAISMASSIHFYECMFPSRNPAKSVKLPGCRSTSLEIPNFERHIRALPCSLKFSPNPLRAGELPLRLQTLEKPKQRPGI